MRGRLRSVVIVGVLLCGLVGCTGGPDDPPTNTARPSTEQGDRLALLQPRAAHTATALPDGSVLIAGGCTSPGCGGFDDGRRSEVFDPTSQAFVEGPTMRTARTSGSATPLSDGRVLFVGGYPAEGVRPTAEAEVFDPRTRTFEPVQSLASARASHTATVLPDGSVLVAGGIDASGEPVATTEVFQPQTGGFSAGTPLGRPRAGHVAVRVGPSVVLVGGTQDATSALDTTEVYRDGRWSTGPRLSTARVKHAAVGIDGQRVLVVAGGVGIDSRDRLRSTEIIDLATGVVSPGPDLAQGQYKLDGAVSRLPDGRVVIAGGDRIQVFDPATGALTTPPGPELSRLSVRTATPVGPVVLVAGGYDDAIVPTDAAHLVDVS